MENPQKHNETQQKTNKNHPKNIKNSDFYDAFWMPFTNKSAFLKQPKLLKKADGMYFYSDNGRKIIDSTSGLWCCNAGHQHPKIIEAIKNQADEMAFCPSFQLAHENVFHLANELVALAPKELNHAFFTNSGSESIDTALKIALAYQNVRGKASKTRIIGRQRGYHGVGFGGISVGGIGKNRMHYGTLLPGVDHLKDTYDKDQAFTKGLPENGAELADQLLQLINLHDASTIAAVIVEPIAGSTGVLLPPKGYLKRLREICTQHDILLIFDEVITGFGRIGDSFASTHWGITPDIITTAKGLSSGMIPIGAVIVKDEIYESFIKAAGEGMSLFHGYTYTGHPIAVAAARAAIQVYTTEGLFETAKNLNEYWQEGLHSLKELPHIIDIRNYGLIGAIEFAPRKDAAGERAFEAFSNAFFEEDLLIRITGDIIALSPALILEKKHIDEIFEKLSKVIKKLK